MLFSGVRSHGMWTSLKTYFKQDLLSGFLVSLIALPLCLGIAGASNFPPIMGVMTAIVGGLFVSFFAGSELTIKGPAAGLIVIVAGAVEELGRGDLNLGWQLCLGVIVVAGIIQFGLGKLKVAALADFFPLSAVHGMLAAIGIIIMSKQIHLALGVMPAELKGKEPLELLFMIPHSLMEMEWHIAVIGGVSLLILFGWKYINKGFLKNVPPALVVIVTSVLLGQYFHLFDPAFQARKPLVNPGDFQLQFLARFEALSDPTLLPIFLKYLLMFVLIGSLESLLTGRAIDLLDPYKQRSDLSRDLSAVGLGNIVSGLLGGLPMIAEVARSSANIANGGRSRWANFYHSAFLLLFVVVLVPFIKMVPVAALAAMLIFVGFRLASPREFEHVFHVGREQLFIFLITIVATLATDLLLGMATGILVKFIIHSVNGVPASSFFKPFLTMHVDEAAKKYRIEVEKSAIFSNYIGFRRQLDRIPKGQTIIIDFEKTRLVDHTVMDNLQKFKERYEGEGGFFQLIGLEEHKALSKHKLASRKKRSYHEVNH